MARTGKGNVGGQAQISAMKSRWGIQPYGSSPKAARRGRDPFERAELDRCSQLAEEVRTAINSRLTCGIETTETEDHRSRDGLSRASRAVMPLNAGQRFKM